MNNNNAELLVKFYFTWTVIITNVDDWTPGLAQGQILFSTMRLNVWANKSLFSSGTNFGISNIKKKCTKQFVFGKNLVLHLRNFCTAESYVGRLQIIRTEDLIILVNKKIRSVVITFWFISTFLNLCIFMTFPNIGRNFCQNIIDKNIWFYCLMSIIFRIVVEQTLQKSHWTLLLKIE